MRSPDPNAADIAMARWLRDVLSPQKRPEILSAWDDSETHFVDVMVCQDVPEGFTTVSTLSMHRSVNPVNGTDIRTELVMMLSGDSERYDLLLGSAALNVVKDSWPMWPGVVYPNIVADNAPGHRVPHLMFTAPGTFPELNRYELEPGQLVHWLQAVPIHESERLYLGEHGLDALEDRLQDADAPVHDLDRDPVV